MLKKSAFFLLFSLLGVLSILFLSSLYHDKLVVRGVLSNFSYNENYQSLRLINESGFRAFFVCFDCSQNYYRFIGKNVSLFFSFYGNVSVVEKLEVED